MQRETGKQKKYFWIVKSSTEMLQSFSFSSSMCTPLTIQDSSSHQNKTFPAQRNALKDETKQRN